MDIEYPCPFYFFENLNFRNPENIKIANIFLACLNGMKKYHFKVCADIDIIDFYGFESDGGMDMESKIVYFITVKN